MDSKYSRKYRLTSCFLCFATGIFLLLHVCCLDACAESTTPEQARIAKEQREAVQNLKDNAKGLRTFSWNPATGVPDFVAADELPFHQKTKGKISEQSAIEFLEEHSKVFELKNPKEEMRHLRTTIGPEGSKHIRLQQTYNGIPVFGAQTIVHVNNDGSITAINGYLSPNIQMTTLPAISSDDAILRVRKVLSDWQTPSSSFIVTLGIFDPKLLDKNESALLVYEVRVGGEGFLVDAIAGNIVLQHLKASTSLGSLQVFDALGGCPTQVTNQVSGDPYAHVERIRNIVELYLVENFGRQGWDASSGSLAVILNWCHELPESGPSGQPDTYCIYFHTPFLGDLTDQVTDDVFAHEFYHGICRDEGLWIAPIGPASLQESLCDIFAVSIDTSNWIVAEGVLEGGYPHGPRDFSQPHDMVSNWGGDSYANCWIHNYVAYLIATSDEIGGDRDKVAKIYYHVLDNYLTPTADFVQAKHAAIEATLDLGYGQAVADRVWASYENALIGVARWHSNGTLVRTVANPDVYLVDHGKKRKFLNETVFYSYGYADFSTVVRISDEEMTRYGSGTAFSLNRNHYLFRSNLSDDPATVWVVDNIEAPSVRRGIISEEVFYSYGYENLSSVPIDDAKFNATTQGTPLFLRPGTLVKGSAATVYVMVEDGIRRPIQDEATFYMLGYDFDNVHNYSDPVLALSAPTVGEMIRPEDVTLPIIDTIAPFSSLGSMPSVHAGSTVPILYNSHDDENVTHAYLSYSLNGLPPFQPIGANLAGGKSGTVSGTYDWSIPGIQSPDARLRLAVSDGGGNTATYYSNAFSIQSPVNPPDAPTLSPISLMAGERNYAVTWSAVSGVDSYHLQEDDNPGFTSPTGPYCGGTSYYYENQPYGTYYYRVAGVVSGVSGAWSNTVSVTVQDRAWPGIPSNPSPPDGATNQNLSQTLTWVCDHPAGESQTFDVIFAMGHRNVNDGYFPGERIAVGISIKSYTVNNLNYNQEYSWRIYAHDQTGDETIGEWWHFWTRNDVIAPTGSVTINGGTASTNSYFVTLGLTASDADSGVAGFRVSNDGTHWRDSVGMQQSVSWNIADPACGGQYGRTTYTVYVRFYDRLGNTSSNYTDSINKPASSIGTAILNGTAYETIEDALAAASPGDTVYLTAGEWNITSGDAADTGQFVNLVIPAGVTVHGSGMGKTILRGNYSFAVIHTEANCALKGLSLIQTYVSGGSKSALFAHGDNLTVDSCEFVSTGAGITFGWYNVVSSQIRRCSIHSCATIGVDAHYTISGSSTSLVNCSIADSGAQDVTSGLGSMSLTNCILASNCAEGIWVQSGGGPAAVSYCDNWNHSYMNYRNMPDPTGSAGNISANPLFVGSGDYSLTAGSPCRNTGINVGLPANGTPDMGAFEYGAAGTVAVNANIPAASFTVYGPAGTYQGSGTGWSMSGLPAGVYAVSFADVANYYTPAYQAQILGHGETLTFNGVYTLDSVAPTGRVAVEHDLYAVTFPRVDMALELEDPVAGLGAGAQMQFSNDGTNWTPLEAYSSLKRDWNLSEYGGNLTPGTKTVYVRISDALGNWTDPPLTDNVLFAPTRQILVVPDDYASVGDALAAANPGDMVHIEPGVYNDLTDVPAGVRLQGSGPDVTTLNASGGYRYLRDGSMIDGLRVSLCRVDGVWAIFSNNIVVGAQMFVTGGARPIIRNNLFLNASSSGILLSDPNSGGYIKNNTFAYINRVNYAALSLQDLTPTPPLAVIENNIFAFNYVGIQDGNFDRRHKLFYTRYNAYWQNSGGNAGGNVTGNGLFGPGCFDSNPLFVAAGAGDYHLQTGSPCLHSGNPEARFYNPDGSRNDRGYTGGPCANTYPVADFVASPDYVAVGENVALDATASGDRESASDEMYFRWDLDNDGTFDTSYAPTPITTTTFPHSGTYTVRLEAMDSGGFVAFAAKTVGVINRPPNPPTNPNPGNGASGVPVTTSSFTWECTDPDEGQNLSFDVYFGETSSPPLYMGDVATLSVALSPLQYATFYFVKVVAKDPEGAATSSDVWYFFTEPEPAPTAPIGLVGTATAWNQVSLIWTDTSSNEFGFKIERSSTAEPTWYQIGISADPQFTDNGVRADTQYTYRVRAYNGTGNSEYSNEAPVLTPVRPTGTVVIEVTPDEASWAFMDGDGIVHEGTGDHTDAAVPTGTIQLTWYPVSWYEPPVQPAAQVLEEGQQIVFSYQYAMGPTAAFHATPAQGYVPLIVQFTDESIPGTAAINSWQWDFGDGGTSSEQNPLHTYVTPVTYSATLTVTTSVRSSTVTQAGGITAGEEIEFFGQPSSARYYTGETARMNVQVNGGVGTVHYQWWFDNGQKTIVPVGSDAAALQISPMGMDDAGAYWCDVLDAVASHSSSTATLEVAPPLVIVQQPENAEKNVGDSQTFALLAEGGYPPLSYQWKKDNLPIEHRTLESLEIPHVTLGDAGFYTVDVMDSNTAMLTTDPATLTVGQVLPLADLVGIGCLIAIVLAGVLILLPRQKVL